MTATTTTITRENWLAALRSGKYQQGIGMLCNDNKYCCLGVAAKIAGKLTIDKYDDKVLWFERDEKKYSCVIVPIGFLNLTSEELDTLMRLNDKLSYTFEQIADYIETNNIGMSK